MHHDGVLAPCRACFVSGALIGTIASLQVLNLPYQLLLQYGAGSFFSALRDSVFIFSFFPPCGLIWTKRGSTYFSA